MTGYARARPAGSWQNFGTAGAAVVDGPTELEKWDQAIYDLKTEGLRANDYAGVDPTGVSDSTTGIATALAAADAVTGLTKLVFNGTYSVSTINFDGINDVWCDFGTSTIKKNVDSTTPLLRNKAGGTANYGQCSGIVLTGGVIDPNNHQTGNGIVGLCYVDGFTIDGMTVIHNQPVGQKDWAFAIGGRKGRITNCRVLNGAALFEDGIHLIHGQDWIIAHNYVESGDDAIVLGPLQSDARLVAHPDPIRRVTITDNVVNAQKAYGFRIFVDSGSTGANWEITDVTVQGLVGQAGVLRNGGINISDTNGTGAGTSQIKRIKVRGVSLAVGSSSHDDVGDPEGILISSASDVSISDVAMSVTSASSPTTGFQLCTITNSEDVAIDRLTCDALGKRYGIATTSSNRVKLSRSRLRCTSGSTSGQLYVSNVRDIRITDNDLLDIPSGISGLTFSSANGRVTRGTVRSNKFAQLTTGGGGIFAASNTVFGRLVIDDNDFSELGTAVNPSTISNGNSGTINHAAGYLSTDTSLVVVDGTKFQFLDIITVTRTGEKIKVNSVSSNTLTSVTRGVLGTTAAALVDTDPLVVRNVILRGNRGIADYTTGLGD